VIDAAIFDMDGTLCDVSSVRHFVARPKGEKDFHSFHEAAAGCPPHQWVLDEAHDLSNAGLAILVVTARSEEWAVPTLWWNLLHEVPFDEIFHRPRGDFRKDVLVKADILADIRRRGYNPVHAYDDNPSIVALWESENIPVTLVPGWA
jgi:hypothetical protein